MQNNLSPVHNVESRETLNRKCLYTVFCSFTVECGACGHMSLSNLMFIALLCKQSNQLFVLC